MLLQYLLAYHILFSRWSTLTKEEDFSLPVSDTIECSIPNIETNNEVLKCKSRRSFFLSMRSVASMQAIQHYY